MALLPTALARSTPGYFADHVQAWQKLNSGHVDVVADFGADRTGVASASDAIQAAVTAAQNAGGTAVYVPPGDYRITTPVQVSMPGLTVCGAGWRSNLFLTAGANGYIFKLVPGSGVRMDGNVFRDLRLDGSAGSQTAGGCIDALGAAYCRFEHLEIRAPWDYGIQLHQDGLGGFGHHNVVRDCWFHAGVLAAPVGGHGSGLYMWSSDENVVSGCTFEANGSGQNNAAHIFETSGLQSFTGCKFVADPNVGSVEFLKMTGARNAVIGNHFDGGTNAQVEVAGDHCTITGNQFYQPIGGNDCILLNGQNNSIMCNAFTSAAANGASRSAINASGASGVNYRFGNVVSTVGSWAGSVYNGSAGQLVAATG